MKLKIQITLRFVVLGVFITTLIFLGVWPLENDLRLISGFHSESLYPIKSLNTKLNDAVKESFAHVVSSDTYEKEEIEHPHRTALDRINLYEKTIYAIALISLFLSNKTRCFFIQNHHQRWDRIDKKIISCKLKFLKRKKSIARPESFPIA
jgi:hypothetical protein